MSNTYLVTGVSGFIGSHMADTLLKQGHRVIGVDNFSTGRREFLADALREPRFRLVERDLMDPGAFQDLLRADVQCVFHFAANADVRHGLKHPRKDLEQNTIVTWNILEAMRKANVGHIVFSSSGSVYGDDATTPTPEDAPFPIQTSLYAASKISAEGFISAYAYGYGIRATIFRFVSILGERYTHGHVFDFVKQLRENPNQLRVLGDGEQKKSYLYVGDCMNAILCAMANSAHKTVEIYNLGVHDYIEVKKSADIICDELKLKPERVYAGGARGWVGDSPFIFLDCKKIRALGWTPQLDIAESVRRTVRFILKNPWVLEARSEE
jgi:UDP-glucose 4-epimerase